jgi:hypothetical protein
MDNRLNTIGSENTPSGYSVENTLWLIALGAAIADKDFRDELIGTVGIGTRNTEVRNMLIALGKGDIGGVHSGAQRLGFPVDEGDRCLPSLLKSLNRRAVSKKCSEVASKLEYCAKLTPENFIQMLKEATEEMESVDSETV